MEEALAASEPSSVPAPAPEPDPEPEPAIADTANLDPEGQYLFPELPAEDEAQPEQPQEEPQEDLGIPTWLRKQRERLRKKKS